MKYRDHRVPCALRVTALAESGRIPCEIINVSQTGARLAGAGAVHRGEVLRLELNAGAEPLPAEVRWMRDGMAGLRFARPLSPGAVSRMRGMARGHAPPAWAGHHAGAREMR